MVYLHWEATDPAVLNRHDEDRYFALESTAERRNQHWNVLTNKPRLSSCFRSGNVLLMLPIIWQRKFSGEQVCFPKYNSFLSP